MEVHTRRISIQFRRAGSPSSARFKAEKILSRLRVYKTYDRDEAGMKYRRPSAPKRGKVVGASYSLVDSTGLELDSTATRLGLDPDSSPTLLGITQHV